MTITIEKGTTIYATPTGADGVAPAIVVEKGGLIIADGTAKHPITFTALDADQVSSATITSDTDSATGTGALGTRGKWGGLILLGKAPTSVANTKEVEGITGKTYGGTDPNDSSGVLRYVRVARRLVGPPACHHRPLVLRRRCSRAGLPRYRRRGARLTVACSVAPD